jgi:hypothetical protein
LIGKVYDNPFGVLLGLPRNFSYLYIEGDGGPGGGGEKKEDLATAEIDVIFRCN